MHSAKCQPFCLNLPECVKSPHYIMFSDLLVGGLPSQLAWPWLMCGLGVGSLVWHYSTLMEDLLMLLRVVILTFHNSYQVCVNQCFTDYWRSCKLGHIEIVYSVYKSVYKNVYSSCTPWYTKYTTSKQFLNLFFNWLASQLPANQKPGLIFLWIDLDYYIDICWYKKNGPRQTPNKHCCIWWLSLSKLIFCQDQLA